MLLVGSMEFNLKISSIAYFFQLFMPAKLKILVEFINNFLKKSKNIIWKPNPAYRDNKAIIIGEFI